MDNTSADHDQTEIEPPSWNYVGQRLYRLDLLEAENKSLRTQIEILTKKQQFYHNSGGGKHSHGAAQTGKQQTVSSSATVRAEEPHLMDDWKQKYEELEKEYASLWDRHAKCGQEIKLKNDKVREARESVKAWKAYADKKASKERDARDTRDSRPPSHAGLEGSDDMTTTPRALPVVQTGVRSGRTESELIPRSDSFEIPSSPPKPKAGQPEARSTLSPTRSVTSRVTSSQTTMDETQQRKHAPAQAKLSSSDSEPVLVSTRSLKRKAGTSAVTEPASRRIKQEPNSPDAPMHIKSEDFSSPHTTPTRPIRTEMSDLDSVGPLMITPRQPHLGRLSTVDWEKP